MLVLKRKRGERVALTLPDGTRIEIVVVEAHGGVRLGIEAPKDVTILRTELEEEGQHLNPKERR